MWLLRDPLKLCDKQIVLPPLLAQMTIYCDGRHTVPMIHQALIDQVGFTIPDDVLLNILEQLDEVFLLDNERSQEAQQAMREAFRAQPFRPPMLAGLNYPADPAELAEFLDGYGVDDDTEEAAAWAGWHGRAIVSPHIDYQRGGEVYAKVWKRAEAAVQADDLDLILMFATDHQGGLGSLTLTPKPYATPYGVLPTDEALVNKLAATLGEAAAYGLELNHRQEHSVELAAVWLHHTLRGKQPPPMVPILIGSFHHFVTNGGHPSRDEDMMEFIATLIEETGGKKVLCIASVDLAHVGPAFQDDYIMNATRRQQLIEADKCLIETIIQGDSERFYNEIAAVQDANKVCGFSPLYLLLRYLNGRGEAPLRGHKIAYQHCSADARNHSLVSICGLLLE